MKKKKSVPKPKPLREQDLYAMKSSWMTLRTAPRFKEAIRAISAQYRKDNNGYGTFDNSAVITKLVNAECHRLKIY